MGYVFDCPYCKKGITVEGHEYDKRVKEDVLNKLQRIFEQRKAFYTQEEVLNVIDFVREKEL